MNSKCLIAIVLFYDAMDKKITQTAKIALFGAKQANHNKKNPADAGSL